VASITAAELWRVWRAIKPSLFTITDPYHVEALVRGLGIRVEAGEAQTSAQESTYSEGWEAAREFRERCQGIADPAPGRDGAEVEWGVRAVWDDGEVAEGPLSEPPNTEGAAREVCKTLINEWAPQVRSAEVVSRRVGPWVSATLVANAKGGE